MKYSALFIIFFGCNSLFAQINPTNIYGSWVKTKLTFKDGSELPDENILKSTYVKYVFTEPDKMNISQSYQDNGTPFLFEILNDEILIRTSVGSIINQIRIEKLGADTMVLQQRGYNSFDDPNALKYYFTRENAYQKSLKLTASDIYKVAGHDTIYKQNQKVYASYKGDSFYQYMVTHIGDENFMTGRGGHLAASFIVSKTGVADSLKILESIAADYDKLYVKAFNKTRKDWKPAMLDGKPVSVQMFTEVSYLTFGSAFSADQYTEKANAAFKSGDYTMALYFYDSALEKIPFDKENLYNRGVCKKMLGNMAGACEDWKKLKKLGGSQADELLAKYCN
jgi:tetratricopeptide (TPR) repeat protein